MRTPPSPKLDGDSSTPTGTASNGLVLYKLMNIGHQFDMETAPIQWNLASVAVDADEVEAEVGTACRRVAVRYRARIGSLSPDELADALAELARIRGALVHLTGVARPRVALNADGAAERPAGPQADP